MRPIILKSCLFFMVGILAIAMPASVLACAYAGPFEVDEVTFFAPEILGDPTAAPFFVTPFHRFYTEDAVKEASADFTGINMDEWVAFFNNRIPLEVWSELLHKATLDRLDALIFRLKGKADSPKFPGDEIFMAFGDRKSLLAALYYVGFAKRVEPYATERSDYWEWDRKKIKIDRSARSKAIATLVEGGTKALEAEKLPFLHRRYAFQLLRLFFYNDEYNRCTKFYEDRRRDFSDGSSIAWRAMGYAAGAHYKAKRYAEANYMFSLLFDQYQPMRIAAAWSFHPQEEADWHQCLSMAKSAREKAVLWQMLGIGADGFRALKKIYALDPKSDLLPLLLVREVNLSELEANVTGQFDRIDFGNPGSRRDLLSFIETVSERGDVAKPWAWDLAAGHLHAMAGGIEETYRCLDRAVRRAPDNATISRQIRISRLFALLQARKEVNPDDEPMLARELTWVKREAGENDSPSRTSAFFDWAKRRLSGFYRQKGDMITALCLNDAAEDPYYADSARIDRFIQFLEKPEKSAFETFVAGEYLLRKNDLVEVKGLNALYAGEYDLAERLFNFVETAVLPADPFEIHIRDNHDRDAEAVGHRSYTKTEFVRRLAQLIREAESGGEKASERYFEAANALYNISWFGNSRMMYVTESNHFQRRPRINDCSHAETFYTKAMELSDNREFKAKACFMASKCELNTYYVLDPEKKAGDFVAGKWFTQLRDAYADTKYYKEVLRECGYFRTYISKHPRGGTD